MLAGCEQWGIAAAVEKFIGMFAFGIFDRETRTLSLVRDRLGVKPLYYTVIKGQLLFGSELRALMAHPDFVKEVDPEALDAMLRYSYVPAPATIFKNVFKLPPASILTVRAGEQPQISTYWPLSRIAQRQPTPRSAADALDGLDQLLRDAVQRRLVADVPLGAWLRGPLRGWAEDLLAPDKLMPMLDAGRVHALWQSYLNDGNDNATGMWNILMAQAWARRWL